MPLDGYHEEYDSLEGEEAIRAHGDDLQATFYGLAQSDAEFASVTILVKRVPDGTQIAFFSVGEEAITDPIERVLKA